ncbi:MAG: preprotein translocase subunit SecG [Francisellaceae bacterium]|jgi:preprotein translocase subunit SecG
MLNIFLAAHIVIALIIIGLVLVQHGKGADMGASFGGGASKTVFGSRGAAPFLMKLTGFFAAIFFATSLTLGYLSKEQVSNANTLPGPATITVPEQISKTSPVDNIDTVPSSSEKFTQTGNNNSPLNQIKDQSKGVGTIISSGAKTEVPKSNSPLDQIKSQSE